MAVEVRETLRFLQHENVRLQRENQALREEVARLHSTIDALRTLQEAGAGVNVHTDALNLLDRILQSALATIGAKAGSLLLIDEETAELVFVVVHGAMREALLGYRISLGSGIAGWVAQHKEPVIVPNARLDPRFSLEVDQIFQFYTHSLLCVPIIQGARVFGVIEALNKAGGREFDEADLTLFGVVAQLAATAMAKAEAAFAEENSA